MSTDEEYLDRAIAQVRAILEELGSEGLTEIVAFIAEEQLEEEPSAFVWQRLAERMKA